MTDTLWLGDSASADAQKQAANSMAAFLARSLGGRAMPSSAQRVLAITDNPSYRVQDVVGVLETDPAMSARVLQLVNSAGYGLQARCKSVHHAVTLLGNQRLRQVATVAGVLHLFQSESEAAYRVREHAIVVGGLARHLAASCNLPAKELFTSGVLHDLGKMMLLRVAHARRGDAAPLVERAQPAAVAIAVANTSPRPALRAAETKKKPTPPMLATTVHASTGETSLGRPRPRPRKEPG